MTTGTEAKVDLATASSNGQQAAPKRRGRPPGSKNKPKPPAKKATTRRTATATSTPLPTLTAKKDVHAVLLEDAGVSFLYADGTTSAVAAPVFDRRTK